MRCFDFVNVNKLSSIQKHKCNDFAIPVKLPHALFSDMAAATAEPEFSSAAHRFTPLLDSF